MSPRISVILPVYNAADYVGEAIESILAQTFADFEILVYDDGSKDNSRAIIDSIKDPRIVRKYSDVNQGLISVLNRGLQDSKYEYIARMDADDIASPERFQKQIELLDSNTQIGICGTQLRLIGSGELLLRPCGDDELRWWIFKGSPLAHPSIMMRRSVITENHLSFDTKAYVAEDFDLWWKMAFHCKMANLDEALLEYRIHPNQESSAKTETQNANHRLSLIEFMNRLGIETEEHTPEFVNKLLSKDLENNPLNLEKSIRFFKGLETSENALTFFGKSNIINKKHDLISFIITNLSFYNNNLFKLVNQPDTKPIFQKTGISTLSFYIKCLLNWKTR